MGANAKEAAQDIRKEWGLPDNAPVGEILRRARGHYNLEISDVEAALRIRASQLTALEQGRFDQLPGRVYAIGFVRAYAEYLGLDGHEMVEIFKKQSGGGSRKPELHFPATASESKVPNFFILAGSFVALVAVLAGFVMFSGQGAGVSEIPDAPQVVATKTMITGQAPLETAMIKALETAATAPLPAPAPVAAAPGQDVQAILNAPGVITVQPATPPAPPSRIVIRVTDAVWLEIRDGAGKALLSRILKAGDIYDVPDQPDMTLATGNAGALAMVIDNQPPVLLGAKGDIKRRVILDADVLKTSLAGNPVVDLPPRPAPQAAQVQQPQQPVAAAPAQPARTAVPRPVRRAQPQPEPNPPVIRTPN